MEIPNEDVRTCRECQGDVIVADTNKKARGETVRVTLEIEEDQVNDTPGSQWLVTRVGRKYHAGQITNKNQRAGMIAQGIRFHLEHGPTCARRKAGYRK